MTSTVINLSIRDELLVVVGHVHSQYKESYHNGFCCYAVGRIYVYVARSVEQELAAITSGLLMLNVCQSMENFMKSFCKLRSRYIRMCNVIFGQAKLNLVSLEDIFCRPGMYLVT